MANRHRQSKTKHSESLLLLAKGLGKRKASIDLVRKSIFCGNGGANMS